MPSPQTPPPTKAAPKQKQLSLHEQIIDKVKKQMEIDKRDLNVDARKRKYNTAYASIFHPDKMGRVETFKEDANKVFQDMENLKQWYLRP